MAFLKIVLFLCLATGQLERTLAAINECVGPPPVYSDSTFDKCVGNQATGSCNCTAPAQTCRQGDQLYYKCDHGTDLDFVIVCDYKDGLGNFGFIIWRNSSEEFEACTGSPAPVQSTPPPQPTFPPSQCSKFNVATWPPEGCIRLVESQTKPHETTGILQVYFNTTWGSVCHTPNWNSPGLVNIACRMLGFSSISTRRTANRIEEAVKYNDVQPGLSRDAWRVNIEHSCPDTEESLWKCTRTEPCWLTYTVRGSVECSVALNISCKVNTTFSDLTSCPPPTTTTPNPTTPNPTTSGPDASTHRAKVTDSNTDQERTTSSGHQSSPKTGLSTGVIVAVALGVTAVIIVATWIGCKRCHNKTRVGTVHNDNAQGDAQQQPVRETDDQSKDKRPTLDESAQEREASDGTHNNQAIDGTSGTTASQTPTRGDSSQSRNAPGSDHLPQVSE